MGRLVMSHSVRSNTLTDNRSFVTQQSLPVSNGSITDRVITDSWVTIYDNDYMGDPTYIVIFNTGDNECIVRGHDKTTAYSRMTLPPGAAMVFKVTLVLSTFMNGIGLIDVYSENGTTVKVGVFF